MDMSFVGGVNSIYALIGLFLMLIFQMIIKAIADKRYREKKEEAEQKKDKDKQDFDERVHKEDLEATNKLIEAQMILSKAIVESLNRNNEITDIHTENILDIAEVIDKKHKTKKAAVYKERYKDAESKHRKPLDVKK